MVNDRGSEIGGAETMVLLLKDALINRGHIVRALTSQENNTNNFSDYTYKSFSDSSYKRFVFYIYNPYSAIKLRKVLKSYQPDVVHLHNVKKASASILFLLRDYPTVMTAHDLSSVDQTAFDKIPYLKPYKCSLSNYFIYKRSAQYYVQKLRFKILRYGQKNIDVILSPSAAMSTVLRQGQINNQICTLYNGAAMDTRNDQYTDVKNKQNVLYVGRIVEDKGIKLLIDAIDKVAKKMSTIHLTICGDGPFLATAKKLSAEKKLQSRITFTGQIDHTKINSYIAASNLVVVPSICFETLGLVAIESLLMKRPVIVSDSGGLAEIVKNGYNGIVVPRNDSGAISDAILKILKDDKFMINAQNNLYLKNKFSISKYTNQTLDVYNDIIETYLNKPKLQL